MKRINFKILVSIMFLSLGFCINSYAQDSELKGIKSDVLKAMGGKKAFNKTNIISWNFFGIRNLIWDKSNNIVRIDMVKENTVMILNINDKTGKVLKNGVEITDNEELSKLLEEALKIWINDSYWLLMPFKLEDPGVNLKYLGIQKTEEGADAKVVEMTFDNVGVTPDNKYHIFFDTKTGLVSQWSHFGSFKDEKPRFTMPWKDYNKYGNIMLSGDRGSRKLSDIKVFDILDPSVFTSFTKPSFLL